MIIAQKMQCCVNDQMRHVVRQGLALFGGLTGACFIGDYDIAQLGIKARFRQVRAGAGGVDTTLF